MCSEERVREILREELSRMLTSMNNEAVYLAGVSDAEDSATCNVIGRVARMVNSEMQS